MDTIPTLPADNLRNRIEDLWDKIHAYAAQRVAIIDLCDEVTAERPGTDKNELAARIRAILTVPR